MDIFNAYKPLRNLLRRYNLRNSLEDIWGYAQMLQDRLPMQRVWIHNRSVPVSEFVYHWDLSVICRELILNADPNGKRTLKNWAEFSSVLQAFRNVEEAVATCLSPQDALLSLQPAIQQQFSWQQKRHLNELTRYFKIFSSTDVDALLVRNTGVPAKVWFFVGLAVAGSMLKSPVINSNQNYEFAGIEQAQSQLVFKLISISFEELRSLMLEEQKYDERWKFTLNPMLRWPLLRLNPSQPHEVHCPVPNYVLQRVSSGLYYDIVATPGFDKPFGSAFEAYVGDVLMLTFPKQRFEIFSEQTYRVGKQEKRTTDWIVSDNQANLFIECKSKRMTPRGKVSSDPEVLKKEVVAIADAVVQVYKAIDDALMGLTPWVPNGRPIYPIVLTLEDWYLFSVTVDLLREEIKEKMLKQRLNVTWLQEMPYTVVSCADFEIVSPTLESVGLSTFFSRRFAPEAERLPFRYFAQQTFPEQYGKTAHRLLFEEEWTKVLPSEALWKNFGKSHP